jgi:hypothetical protein
MKVRHDTRPSEENVGDHSTHGQHRNTLIKPLRNLKNSKEILILQKKIQNLILPIIHTTIKKWIIH